MLLYFIIKEPQKPDELDLEYIQNVTPWSNDAMTDTIELKKFIDKNNQKIAHTGKNHFIAV